MKKSNDAALFFMLSAIASVSLAGPEQAAKTLYGQAQTQNITFSTGVTGWKFGSSVRKLADGSAVIVRTTGLRLDTDGAPTEVRACDSSQQSGTSLHDLQGAAVNANAVPYFVLPCTYPGKGTCPALPPYQQLHLELGDVAVVISGDKIAYAIAADFGPEDQFGEGSIQLHRDLGHEVVGKIAAHPQCAANETLRAVTYLVIFPKSHKPGPIQKRLLSNDQIAHKAEELWKTLLAPKSIAP